MLTTNEFFNIEEYAFKSSPESCSGNSCFTDCTDLPSDEDFLQQLSSDLDIPLLLNPGEDELNLLNSFFDKSPDEIMSEIAMPSPDSLEESVERFIDLPTNSNITAFFSTDVKVEPPDNVSSSSSNKSLSPVQSPVFEIKDEVKSEPHSPTSPNQLLIHKTENDPNILFTSIPNNRVKIVPALAPIQPKLHKNSPSKKVVLLKNDYKRTSPTNIVNATPTKVVVLENCAATTVAQIPTTLSNTIVNTTVQPVLIKGSNLGLNVGSLDPKVLKRVQRKIKNRESASLSRKKKKDYVTSLEQQVSELKAENDQLKLENNQLKDRLMKYESQQVPKTSHVKAGFVLCMFLFSMAFNLDYIRSPISQDSAALAETNPLEIDHHGRNLLWATDEVVKKNSSKFSPFTMCPAYINQTESARLALELERWIGKPADLPDKPNNVTNLSVPPVKAKPLRKRKQKRYHTTILSSVYNNHNVPAKLSGEGQNELQVFSPTAEQLYSEFFEAINRQDDTFYVVSFSDHHMLLPALHHNKTRRPKMSLIMPSVLAGENVSQPTLVPLMQIDCEVLDTRLIQIRYGSIPQHLRKAGNSTYQSNESVTKTQPSPANYTSKKAYKPYFIKQKAVRPSQDHDVYNLS